MKSGKRNACGSEPRNLHGHPNWDRDSHFIFGDVATAVIVGRRRCRRTAWLETRFPHANAVLKQHPQQLPTALTRVDWPPDKLFVQRRKVFKECAVVAEQITAQLQSPVSMRMT